jgi:hypothetical protein
VKLWLSDDTWVDTRGDPWVVSWHAGHKQVEKGNVDDLLYKIGLAVADLLMVRRPQRRARLTSSMRRSSRFVPPWRRSQS